MLHTDLKTELEYNTVLHYSGNEINSEFQDQETYSCQMKFNPADLKWKLCQLDKEALVCQISATRASDGFHSIQNIHCSVSVRKFAEISP